MKLRLRRSLQLALLFVLAALMFLASGMHDSYFCVSPWVGGRPLPSAVENAHP